MVIYRNRPTQDQPNTATYGGICVRNMRLAVERRVRNCNGRSLYDGTSAEVGGAAACCGAHDGPDFCFSSGLWVWPAAESGVSGGACPVSEKWRDIWRQFRPLATENGENSGKISLPPKKGWHFAPRSRSSRLISSTQTQMNPIHTSCADVPLIQ